MLEVEFLNTKFKNPLVLASGIVMLKAKLMANVIKNGAAAVTMKSITVEPVQGHPQPVVHMDKYYYLNAVGLAGPGVKGAIGELKQFKKLSDGILLGSIFGRTIEEFGKAAAMIGAAPIDFLEVDISCPHAEHLYAKPFAYDIDLAVRITKIVKSRSSVPVIIKLSPHVLEIAQFAKAIEEAGADAITATNTLGGMKIDIRKRKPVLGNKVGGVSGPALRPIALKAVWDIAQVVKIPIIGTGGIITGEDALAMIMAGARLIGVGSALYYRGSYAMQKIAQEMEEIMQREGFTTIEEMIGLAHATVHDTSHL